jgi:predicted nucleic-acid-binding Zn-ribbon protein
MICQAVKREQWVDKLRSTLLEVPYMHVVFTVPHQLNSLYRQNQSVMYSLTMKVAWKTIKSIGVEQNFTPGMTSVLHTFGSDMKYHIHVHTLVSYGGLSKNGQWIFPREKNKIEKYEKICKRYRSIFLDELQNIQLKKSLIYHQDFDALINSTRNIRWVVNSTRPTMDTNVIENYLARYINRVAVSPNRLHYAKDLALVNLHYNDYKNQIKGQPAPKLIKVLQPLEAIHQILQHTTPAYFQKSRRYGLHNESTTIKKKIPDTLKRNGQTVRTVFEILTQLLKFKDFTCVQCGNTEMIKEKLYSDPSYIISFLSKFCKPPPIINQQIQNSSHYANTTTSCLLPKNKKLVAYLLKSTF